MPSEIEKLKERIRELEKENHILKENNNVSPPFDITEYANGEFEKKQSLDLCKTLINTISDTIVITDLAGKIEFASLAGRIAATPKNNGVVGGNIMDWFDKRNQYKVRENIHKVLNNIPNRFEEYEVTRKDGSKFHAEIRTTLLRNEEGKPWKLISLIQDISFRKKSEEVLRETQNLYRTIIELSPEGILITHNGEILFLNAAMAGILDTDNQWGMVGKHFSQVVKKSYLAKVNAILKGRRQQKESGLQIDIKIESLSGAIKDVTVRASPIVYDGKNCVFLFISDITERIHAERRLKHEMQLMDTFWEHVPDSITFKNKKGEFFRVNEEFLKWINMKNSEDILGKTDRDVFGYRHFVRSKAEEKKIFEKGELIINEIREEVWPDKNQKWVMLTKMPLYDMDQKIVGVFSIARDVTQEKKSEIETREREEWFRYIFDNSLVGKIITDNRFRIKTFNRSALELLGYPREKLLGARIAQFFEKKAAAKLTEKFKHDLKERGDSFQEEFLLKTLGVDKHVIVQGIKVNDQSKKLGEYLIHLIDIHSRKVAENQLLVRNSELNNFVYKVSHDLKAPLTSIKGLINLMKLENDTEVFYQYIQMISSRVDRLDCFIRDVLSHSKNLNVEVKVEPVDINAIIEECLSQISFNPVFKNIKTAVTVSGPLLHSDPHRLHEILRNLISNAFQYSRNNIANPYVKIEAKTTKKHCKICIEDNGIGIKKKYQQKIFDMFYRANEKVEGSGIGLYIVKQSVEKLGGDISFSSAINRGTQFQLLIPNHPNGRA